MNRFRRLRIGQASEQFGFPETIAQSILPAISLEEAMKSAVSKPLSAVLLTLGVATFLLLTVHLRAGQQGQRACLPNARRPLRIVPP